MTGLDGPAVPRHVEMEHNSEKDIVTTLHLVGEEFIVLETLSIPETAPDTDVDVRNENIT